METELLLACGVSGRWSIDVDESLDGNEWSLDIEGPAVDLSFQLANLEVIPKALRFLKSGPGSAKAGSRRRPQENVLHLGCFSAASVSLRWDDEDFPRCFIVVGPRGRSTLHITLWAEDIEMLIDALLQVVKEMRLK